MKLIRVEDIRWSTTLFYADILYANFWGNIKKMPVCARKLDCDKFLNAETGKQLPKRISDLVLAQVFEEYLKLD